MPIAQRRRPRFRRADDNLPGLRITPRDIEIMRRLSAHRFLRSTHFAQLLAGSPQGILRRLALLFHHGYIERPRAQLDGYFRTPGSEPMAYGLASRGAALLRAHGVPFEAMQWRRKRSSPVGTLFLRHALLVADCLVAAEVSCDRHGTRFLRLSDLDLPDNLPPARAGRWSVTLDQGDRVGVVPDATFALESPEGLRRLFFLEADRGTMPVRRRRLDQSSFHRKLLAYRETWRSQIHRERFGIDRVRILTVTESAERLDHLLEACRDLRGGQGLFLFAHAAQLGNEADFLSLGWRSAHGHEERLIH